MENEYAVLEPEAMEPTGFKVVQNKPICEVSTLDEARTVCFHIGGGTIFRLRRPIPPAKNGGHQEWGDNIPVSKLEWQNLVGVITPGTMGADMILERNSQELG